MKMAITVTIDIECAQKVKEQSLSASKYINDLIIDDMQGDLTQLKLNKFIITGRCQTPGPCRGTEHFANETHCEYCKGEL